MSGGIDIVTAAAKWASIGQYVFPYVAKAKVPFGGSHGHLDASDDPEAVVRLFRHYIETTGQTAGIGVWTGASGISTIDCDNTTAGSEFRRITGDAALKTLVMQTRRGWQFFYRVPKGIELPNGSARLRGIEGLDHRSGSSWAALPPSKVKTLDAEYRFPRHDLEFAIANFWDLAIEMPESVLDLILNPESGAPAPGGTGERRKLRSLIDDGRLKIPTGARNEGLHAVSGFFRNIGMSEESILGALAAVNAHDCEEPLPEKELRGIAKSIAKKEPGTLPGAEPWPDVLPLDSATQPPPLPAGVLPPDHEAWVRAVAEATQTPPDFAAILSLGVIATAVQRAVDIDLGAWAEPLVFWAFAVGSSGDRKSTALDLAVAPLIAAERSLRDEFAPLVREAEGDEKAYTEALKKAKEAEAKALGSDNPDSEAIAKARQHRRDLEAKVCGLQEGRRALPYLFTEDASAEAYLRRAAEQGGALSLVSDEGGVFDSFGTKWGNDPNLAPLLKMHSGMNPIRIDRQQAGEIRIDRPRGSVIVALQPEAITDIGRIPGAAEKGLIPRMVAVFPESLVGTRSTITPPIPDAVASAYSERIQALASFAYRVETFHVLRLDAAARRSFDQFRERHELRLAPGGDLAPMASWGSKMPGLVGRLAGLFHLYTEAAHGLRTPVPEETVERAIRFAEDYLIGHAFRLHDQAAGTPEQRAAREILSWIVKERRDTFDAREVSRAKRRIDKKTRSAALQLLRDPHGIVRPSGVKDGTRRETWEVNPGIHAPRDGRDNEDNHPPGGSSSALSAPSDPSDGDEPGEAA